MGWFASLRSVGDDFPEYSAVERDIERVRGVGASMVERLTDAFGEHYNGFVNSHSQTLQPGMAAIGNAGHRQIATMQQLFLDTSCLSVDLKALRRLHDDELKRQARLSDLKSRASDAQKSLGKARDALRGADGVKRAKAESAVAVAEAVASDADDKAAQADRETKEATVTYKSDFCARLGEIVCDAATRRAGELRELEGVGEAIYDAAATFEVYEDKWTQSLKKRLERLDQRITNHQAVVDADD